MTLPSLQTRILQTLNEHSIPARDIHRYFEGIDRGALDCGLNALTRAGKIRQHLGQFILTSGAPPSVNEELDANLRPASQQRSAAEIVAGWRDRELSTGRNSLPISSNEEPKRDMASETPADKSLERVQTAVNSMRTTKKAISPPEVIHNPDEPRKTCTTCRKSLPELSFQLSNIGGGRLKTCRKCMGEKTRQGKERRRRARDQHRMERVAAPSGPRDGLKISDSGGGESRPTATQATDSLNGATCIKSNAGLALPVDIQLAAGVMPGEKMERLMGGNSHPLEREPHKKRGLAMRSSGSNVSPTIGISRESVAGPEPAEAVDAGVASDMKATPSAGGEASPGAPNPGGKYPLARPALIPQEAGDNRDVSTERSRQAAAVPETSGSHSRSDPREDARTPGGPDVASAHVGIQFHSAQREGGDVSAHHIRFNRSADAGLSASAENTPDRNQADSTSSGVEVSAPAPTRSLPNSLGGDAVPSGAASPSVLERARAELADLRAHRLQIEARIEDLEGFVRVYERLAG
jgi:hypothetical protein